MTGFRTPIAAMLACTVVACTTKGAADTGPVSDAHDSATDDTTDVDGDGYGGATDCDDASAAIHPGADEVCDGLDNDCDGDVDESPTDGEDAWFDEDGDGYGDPDRPTLACSDSPGFAHVDGDCDDAEPLVNPAAQERCDDNNVDEDCDGQADDDDDSTDPASTQLWWTDADGDGFGDPAGASQSSCDDPSDATAQWSITNTDCDDVDPTIHPDATERCDVDDTDEDCDGLSDDDDPSVDLTDGADYFPDADTDGYGDADAAATRACDVPTDGSWSLDPSDCDDSEADVNPAATEVCDAADTDEDCDGLTDDSDPTVDLSTGTPWYRDTDGDGYGASVGPPTSACDDPSTSGDVWLADSSDCDDGDAAINPAATEVCDALDTDEDCDSLADDDDSSVDASTTSEWFIDADDDGHGDADAATVSACDDPSSTGSSYAATATDCDDDASAVNPDATEVCDDADTDEDCSGAADDDDPGVDTSTLADWTVDADGDGYGDQGGAAIQQCADPSTAGTRYVDDATDCDDTDATISPAATEVCDPADVDEDCDGAADDADSSADAASMSDWFEDADLDGFGDQDATPVPACDDPSGATTTYVDNDSDCDDGDDSVNPLATEVYGDGLDQACDTIDYPQFSCSGYTVPGSYSTISAAASALGDSSSVQTICLSARTYTENPTLSGNLKIVGPSQYEATIKGHVTVNAGKASSTVDIQGVTITNGVEILDNHSVTYTTTLSDCIIETSGYHGVHIERDGYGDPNTVIERCVVHGTSAAAAVYLYDYSYNSDAVSLTVRDSTIIDGSWGIRTAVTSSSSRSPDQRVTLTNNTIDGANYGIYAAGRGSTSSHFIIYNNILINNGWAFYFNGKGNISNDYNLYYGNSSRFSGSATGGANRITSDPGLSADTPPVPTAGGSADGAGHSSYNTGSDYWTNPRSSPPSIGAVEPH